MRAAAARAAAARTAAEARAIVTVDHDRDGGLRGQIMVMNRDAMEDRDAMVGPGWVARGRSHGVSVVGGG